MRYKKLSGTKIGVVFGTFAPMHLGHIDLINQAKRENDGVLVIVSGTNTDRDRGTQVGLPLNRRWRYVREVFKDDELTVVEKLDEENIPAYPNGWNEWLDEVEKLIQGNVVNGGLSELDGPTINFYVGETEYVEEIEKRCFLNAEVTFVERSSIPISATKIRENPLKYWRFIARPFRRVFTKKVLVIGSASGGKTTLVKDLARVYNAPYSLEYAREYQETYNVRDEELNTADYIRLLDGQFAQTAKIIDDGNNSGLVFADTNSSVTKAYFDYYLSEDVSEEENETIDSLYNNIVKREDWDIVFLILPYSEYVDDGFRDMTMADTKIRDNFTNHLKELVKPFEDKLVILGSKENNYIKNYEKAKLTIEEKLNIKIGE